MHNDKMLVCFIWTSCWMVTFVFRRRLTPWRSYFYCSIKRPCSHQPNKHREEFLLSSHKYLIIIAQPISSSYSFCTLTGVSEKSSAAQETMWHTLPVDTQKKKNRVVEISSFSLQRLTEKLNTATEQQKISSVEKRKNNVLNNITVELVSELSTASHTFYRQLKAKAKVKNDLKCSWQKTDAQNS